ncbi:SPOR domain-containing protein [Pandoraea oxalativorans]|uniref:SPOR domain-containing protein n=1 Tax=Pandoraea oxalativorans TaxID=573737 RepID=A0A0G3IBD2_9BURK|nr:SPOR domain-containing protein [Pandoraea oxalativorans]AKK23916.1 hypothetical protein MB84_25780 [Pandoraea oxalativorans]
MLRALLLVMFLAANAALAAVQLGWLKWRDVLPETGREPARVKTQLDPTHIRLTGADISGGMPVRASSVSAQAPDNASASAASSAAATAATQAVAPATPSAVASDASAAQAVAAAAASTCLDIGPFAANDAQQARGLLLAALPAGQGDIQSVAVDKRYWVHLDPVPNKAAADKQVAQLRSAGVTEYFLLNDEGSNIVVSLGLFNDKDRATRLMAVAQKKGSSRNSVEGFDKFSYS